MLIIQLKYLYLYIYIYYFKLYHIHFPVAYLRRGGYNVFMLDWGQLCQPPCYVAAVHNLRPVARCVAEALGSLRKAGLRPDRLTCVGHSLGAHMCGIMANYLNFRLNRIIGNNHFNLHNTS